MEKPISKRFALTGILLGMAVLGTGWSSINMALASIQADLSATVLELQWMMNVYGICICIPLLTVGKLGDAYGRKLFYMIGLAGLGIACFGAAFARSPEWLILCMALFGLSGASVMTLSQALTVHQFPESQKGKAVALWATFTSMALAAGPLIGGAILTYLSWRWIFWINVLISIGALFLVLQFVKRETTHSTHCDWGGVALLAILVSATVTGILQAPNWGWESLKILGLFLLGLLALIFFIVLEKKSKEPLFRPDLFSHPNFLFASICNGCLIGFIWAIFFFVPLYLQNEKGISSFQTGLTMLLITLPVVIFSVPVSKLYGKIGAKPLLIAGFFLLALSVFFQWAIPIEVSCLVMGMGWVLAWGPSISTALSTLPHHMAGIASGMFMTLQEIGGILGLAAAGVAFRAGTNHHLSRVMSDIETAFGDQTGSFISNPKAVKALVKSHSILFDWISKGFQEGYTDMLWFLTALMLIALISALLLPKNKEKPH